MSLAEYLPILEGWNYRCGEVPHFWDGVVNVITGEVAWTKGAAAPTPAIVCADQPRLRQLYLKAESRGWTRIAENIKKRREKRQPAKVKAWKRAS
ncbi:hypothetical protein GTO27_02500 [Candidatus Bathyarchaeota archaeon]|nr:hypothetical protein [Candidatus Bathyarchaeota archaeon]